MNTKNTNNSLFQKDQLKASLKQSFVKLNPRLMVKNPIMFTVEIATFFMLPVTVYSAVSGARFRHSFSDLAFCQLCGSHRRSTGQGSG